jgi:hypothetical protein
VLTRDAVLRALRLAILEASVLSLSCPVHRAAEPPEQSDLFGNMIVGKPFRSGPWTCVWETEWSGTCSKPRGAR